MIKFDVKTIRILGRLTDRMDAIRKNPHRYEIEADDLTEIHDACVRLEAVLVRVKTLKAG